MDVIRSPVGSVAQHRERGTLLIRERIELLLDRNAPFRAEPVAGWGTDFTVGGGVVSGIGVVSGVMEHLVTASTAAS